MKFTTNTNLLKEALAKLGHAVQKKSVLPAIQNILVTLTDQDTITLTTTDLLVTIDYKLLTDLGTREGEGQFLMPYSLLKDIVSLENGSVTIVYDPIKGAIANFEKDTFSLGNSCKPEEFPKPQKVGKMPYSVGKDLITALGMAALNVSKEEFKPVLQHICMELSSVSINVTATDANSIYNQVVSAELQIDEPTEILIPSVIAKVLEGFEETTFGFNKNSVAFTSGPVTIATKRGEGKYVTWRAVMPEHTANIKLDLAELKQAVAKAYVVSDSTYNGIDLFIYEGHVELKTEVQDSGMGCSIIVPAETSSPVTQIRFNGRLLKRMVSQLDEHIKENTSVTFGINDANKAATMKPDANNNATVLIMPIRIN